jgi:hypothetical protein
MRYVEDFDRVQETFGQQESGVGGLFDYTRVFETTSKSNNVLHVFNLKLLKKKDSF